MCDVQYYLDQIAGMADVIRADADAADERRRLGHETVEALRASGVMRVLLPKEYGGGELPVSESFPLVEALARVNGSAGWNLQIGLATTAVAADLADKDARDEVFGDPRSMIAGTINFASISARRAEGGYVFNGPATLLSGSSYANWIVIGGWLRDRDGRPQFGDTGMPIIVRGVVPASALEINDTWHVSGMRATASNDSTLDGFFLSEKWLCALDGPALHRDDPAAFLPMFTRFGCGIAWAGIGAARGALDAFSEVAGRKAPTGHRALLADRGDVQMDAARAHGLVESGAAFLRGAWNDAIAKLKAGAFPDLRGQALLRLSYITAAEYAAGATDIVMRNAGTAGLYRKDGIERFWRDANTVPKHLSVSMRMYDRVGRILLDQPPLAGPI